MNNHNITYRDIELYQTCPLILTIYRDRVLIPEKKYSIIEKILINTIRDYFLKSYSEGKNLTQLFYQNSINDLIRKLERQGLSKRKINNLTVNARLKGIRFIEEVTNKYYEIVAIEREFSNRFNTLFYNQKISLLYYSPLEKNFIAVIFESDINNRFILNKRSNFFRYMSALVYSIFDKPLTKIYIITAKKGFLNNTGTLEFNTIKYIEEDNIKALKNLRTQLSIIEQKNQPPNTAYCERCVFLKECNL
jgi:hypothetical protein